MKPIHTLIALSAGLAICAAATAVAGANRDRGMGHRQVPGAAGAEAGQDRRQGDRGAGDGFHQADLHAGAPQALRGLRCRRCRSSSAEARAKGALIIYSVAVPNSVPADILPALTPAAGEQVLPPLGPDKFINSDLEKTLKDKGIKTVVAMGTQAQTSVLHTGATAALKGFKVIVPVDGMSGDEVFPGALHRLASRDRGADQQQRHADEIRDDRV